MEQSASTLFGARLFEDKVALVTGAASGIGREIATAFAEGGAGVAVTDRNADRGGETVRAVEDRGAEGLFVKMDVADAEEVEAGVRQALDAFGRLDCVVTSAGIEQPHTLPLDRLETDEMDRVVDTNLKGTWLTLKYALPRIARPGGTVCLVSSLWGTLGGAGLSAYTATKGGVDALTRSLAVEQGPDVRVNCVSPGAIQTPMLERFSGGADMGAFYEANVPLGRAGNPREVAAAVVWLCSDAASYVTGQVLAADGGITSKMPSANG